jgi:endo-1,4-beta-mannosidase
MTLGAAPFELGINYWPRRRAMYMWRELDLTEVRSEMAHIAAMGFDSVRIFTLLRDFLPACDRVDTAMIARLVDVVRVAADAGLRVVPTLLVLNMSGRIWWPEWMLDAQGAPRNLYDDANLVRAQATLVRECASALAGEPSIRAFDIANEIDDAQRPACRESGRTWVATMADAIRLAAPGIPVRIGAHLPSLTTTNHMRLDDLAALLDENVMHAYPLYSQFARSFLDPELVPFACALAAGLAADGRATLMQEFGLCTAPQDSPGITIIDEFLGEPRTQYLASEEEGADYYDAVVKRLVATGAGGAYAWCYADYDAQLFDRPPFDRAIRERSFGLVRADGSEKPAAGVFRALRARRDAGALERGIVPTVLDVTPDEYHRAPAAHFERLYARWTEAVA